MAKIPFNPEKFLAPFMGNAKASSVRGDLEERFQRICKARGPAPASLWFCGQFLRSLPSFIAKAVLQAVANPVSEFVSLDCLPVAARPDGYAEPAGEIRLKMRPKLLQLFRRTTCDIKLFLNTQITSRIDEEGLPDVVLIDKRNRTVARGRFQTNPFRANLINFESVPIDLGTLTIKGLRFNVTHLGFPVRLDGSGRPAVRACLQVFASGVTETPLLQREAILAQIGSRMNVTLAPTTVAITPTTVSQHPGRQVRSFLVTFHAPFHGYFKTRQEESVHGEPVGNGTVLALQLNTCQIPKECRVFLTARDIPSNGTDAEQTKALAVETDPNGKRRPNGNSVNAIREEPAFLWANTVPMLPMQLSGLTCWEVVAPLPEDGPQTLTFGLAMEFPIGLNVPQPLTAVGSLAPYYVMAAASVASGTLPVPRFVSLHAPINIPLQ